MTNSSALHRPMYQPHLIAAGLRANAKRNVIFFTDERPGRVLRSGRDTKEFPWDQMLRRHREAVS